MPRSRGLAPRSGVVPGLVSRLDFPRLDAARHDAVAAVVVAGQVLELARWTARPDDRPGARGLRLQLPEQPFPGRPLLVQLRLVPDRVQDEHWHFCDRCEHRDSPEYLACFFLESTKSKASLDHQKIFIIDREGVT